MFNPETLLENLCALPRETEWVEFKQNHFDAEEVGRYVSALANSAMLTDQPCGYLVFGVEDGTHEIVGTAVRLKDESKGGELFENWLTRWLDPRLHLEIVDFWYKGKRIGLIRIEPAYQKPVSFKNERFIRIGSVTKPLREYPEHEKALWLITSRFTFEQAIAAQHYKENAIFEDFYCTELLKSLRKPTRTPAEIVDGLILEELIIDNKQGGFDITNLFALLAARDLDKFPIVRGKAPRVVEYIGKDKLKAKGEVTGRLGYAVSFKRLLKYILDRTPHSEKMKHGLRVTEYEYPEISIREFLANALIHQDLTVGGGYPYIEIFSDRLQLSNPGRPLIPIERFIDATPRSRNIRLAKMMRNLGLCEERGSGVDRAIAAIEDVSLPPPLFKEAENYTVVTLYTKQTFAHMAKDERLRACYQHACLRQEKGDFMSNGSLRRRFGLSDARYSQVSIVIREAIDANLIKPLDVDQGNRNARYVPVFPRPIM